MSNLDSTDSQTSLPRGSGKPQAGETLSHPGRGGQNVYIDDAPSSNHPRGSDMVGQDEGNESSSGFARGSGKPQAGEPVSHPGRGGQNVYIDDAPSANHPRGSGAPHAAESLQSASDKQSSNGLGLDARQLAVVQDRINAVMQNQSTIEM
jgi:hypothetical protein